MAARFFFTLGATTTAGEFFAVGASGSIFRHAAAQPGWSSAIPGWVTDSSPTRQNLNAVASGEPGVIAVGDGGTILFHPRRNHNRGRILRRRCQREHFPARRGATRLVQRHSRLGHGFLTNSAKPECRSFW